MKSHVVDLDEHFPECGRETERQGIPQFACCVRNAPTPRCDKALTCRFASGVFHREHLKRRARQTGEIEPPGVFCGKSKAEGGFVVLQIVALPVFTQAKWKPRSVDDLVNVLLGEKKEDASGKDADGN